MAKAAGVFSSPGYPTSYPVSTDCVWEIETEPGSRVELTVKNFDIESANDCAYDFLQVIFYSNARIFPREIRFKFFRFTEERMRLRLPWRNFATVKTSRSCLRLVAIACTFISAATFQSAAKASWPLLKRCRKDAEAFSNHPSVPFTRQTIPKTMITTLIVLG